MPIRFFCIRCGQRLSIGTRKAGQATACPKCAAEVTVPHPLAAGPVPAPSGTLQQPGPSVPPPPEPQGAPRGAVALVCLLVVLAAAGLLVSSSLPSGGTPA